MDEGYWKIFTAFLRNLVMSVFAWQALSDFVDYLKRKML